MSVLDTFIRIRGFRDRAAEYYRLAAEPFNLNVRERYLAIADHYAALADGELVADRLARKRRLQDMNAERNRKSVVASPVITSPTPPLPRPSEPPKLRVIAGGAQGSRRTPRDAASLESVPRLPSRSARD
jgi:hypothetical protein